MFINARFLLRVKNYDIKVGHIALPSDIVTGNSLFISPLILLPYEQGVYTPP